tara:strand:+ start:20475 stop:22256 length:1782 start_codon:yes stop_codon:yes gene_type:complete
MSNFDLDLLNTEYTAAANCPQALLRQLRAIVGNRNVISRPSATERYTTGFRSGFGSVLAVLKPRSLLAFWRLVNICVANDVIIIVQAANTGLTGGSTPNGDYDRPVILINTMHMSKIHLIDSGRQVICLPGTTLYALEKALSPLGREPHSLIGSSCIGASVMGGVCNNSGGSLVQRGPAYTELALYARVASDGALHLTNHLGVRLGDNPETILQSVENGEFSDTDIDLASDRAASDNHYSKHVRNIAEATPARFNADPSRLFEASGSAGKVVLMAVRLDTFPAERDTRTFYIGTNDPEELGSLRRDILGSDLPLPIAAEYMHREAFDMAAAYGKDTYIAIRYLGTDRLPLFFSCKARIDALVKRLPFVPNNISDHLLQLTAKLFPPHLPSTMMDYRDRYTHHLMLKVSAEAIDETRCLINSKFPTHQGSFFECTEKEASAAFLHRFATAGAAIRYRAIHHTEVEDIVALDIALRRDDEDWLEKLPADIKCNIVSHLYYGHFLCHVFHQDYIVAKGTDLVELKNAMLKILDARGAEYPAEHNVGHHYYAKPELLEHYRGLDPTNTFNPGVGITTRNKHWAASESNTTGAQRNRA